MSIDYGQISFKLSGVNHVCGLTAPIVNRAFELM